MQSNEIDDVYNTASPCGSGSQVTMEFKTDVMNKLSLSSNFGICDYFRVLPKLLVQ